MDTANDTAYKAFKEETTDALLDKEFYLVALGTAAGTVKLATSVDDAIGVLFQKQPGNPHVTVRLLGKGGTVKVIAGGVIAKAARVIWGTGAKVITQPATGGIYRTLGRKLSQGSSASGDIIEIDDIIEGGGGGAVVATQVTLTSTNGTAAAASGSLANLAAEAEKIGDDVRAIHAALVTAGLLAP